MLIQLQRSVITDKAAEGVEFIFGTAFKEDMQDEMDITVIAAGFDDPDSNTPAAEETAAETPEEDVIRSTIRLLTDLASVDQIHSRKLLLQIRIMTSMTSLKCLAIK